MRAILISEPGGPESLVPGDVADPRPGEGDVLVEVDAIGVNFIDTYHRTGLYPVPMPFVPGVEGAGTVVETGPGVSEVSPGDRVAWMSTLGSYAQLAVVPASAVVPVPDGVETKTAAAVLLQGLTAHFLVVDTFPLGPGHRCLIHAGAGGVGLLLTQMAKMRGAEVITTVGTAEKAEVSRGAGADHVIIYTETDFVTAVEDLVGPHALDVVYDGVGRTTMERGLDLLRPRGMMVALGNASGPPDPISPLLLSRKGSLYLTRPTLRDYTRTRDETSSRTDDLFSWLLDGVLTVRVGAEYRLEMAAEAHRALEERRTVGKVLLLPR